MKLLIVLPRFPYPLEKGDQLRAFHQIKELSLYYDIYLFAVVDKTEVDEEYIYKLEPYCQKICISRVGRGFLGLGLFSRLLKNFFKKMPLQLAYFYSKKSKKLFDLFYEESKADIAMCQLFRTSKYLKDKPIFKIIDYQDVFSLGMYKLYINEKNFFKKKAFKYEYKAIQNMEEEAFQKFDIKTIISLQDRDSLPLTNKEKERLKIWKNGVDTELFKRVEDRDINDKFDIVFTGNMAYTPNEDAAEFLVNKIVPKLRIKLQREPKVLIAGTSPSFEVRQLASENVNVTGWIKEMKKAYSAAKIFVAPMRLGTGMQNKLIEAMSCELPCFASDIACRGLGSYENMPLYSFSIANDDIENEIVDKMLELIENEEKRRELGKRARDFVSNNFAWGSMAEQLKNWVDEDFVR